MLFEKCFYHHYQKYTISLRSLENDIFYHITKLTGGAGQFFSKWTISATLRQCRECVVGA